MARKSRRRRKSRNKRGGVRCASTSTKQAERDAYCNQQIPGSVCVGGSESEKGTCLPPPLQLVRQHGQRDGAGSTDEWPGGESKKSNQIGGGRKRRRRRKSKRRKSKSKNKRRKSKTRRKRRRRRR